MKCYSQLIRNGTLVPCGQCTPCRINQKRAWASRIFLETLSHGESNTYFITLTYDDANLPLGRHDLVPSVEKPDAQKFLKRLRKRLHPHKIRYFLVGEYGDRFGRPHYHLVLWSDRRRSTIAEAVSASWTLGNIDFPRQSVQPVAVANYVSGYVTKKLNPQDHPDRLPEFSLASRDPMLGFQSAVLIVSKLPPSKRVDIPVSFNVGKTSMPFGSTLRRALRVHFGITDAKGDLGNAPSKPPIDITDMSQALDRPDEHLLIAALREYRKTYPEASDHDANTYALGVLNNHNRTLRSHKQRRKADKALAPKGSL